PGNWSEYPNIDGEVRTLVDDCEWFRVYDLIEGIMARMMETSSNDDVLKFQNELNEYFIENGVGWKIVGGLVEIRGHEAFEESVHSVIPRLDECGLIAARREIHEALHDLSRRPIPDMTG
ncbi:MAG TPA: hypothetical protein PLA50_11890, partial [Bacteroidia bacterium]|nr:hypothetical protein [Bacteroidia bacterium]